MGQNVLVTGGAGFIGSHVADELLRRGHRVRVLDSLVPQVHGRGRKRPTYIPPEVELIVGDVRDSNAVDRALAGIDAVFHLAAVVGLGQSMYQLDEYTDVNARGTAVLLSALAKKPVQRLLVASSMSVYGEGAYVDDQRQPARATPRSFEQLRLGNWEPVGEAGEPLSPVATDEAKPIALESNYALTKYNQERLALLTGRAYGIPTVALRLANVYGPRQAVSNPYAGVLASFAARLLNDRAPLIFEDGRQKRDFVSVHDVARAFMLAFELPAAVGSVFNIGSGRAVSISEVATALAGALKKNISPEVTSKHRVGDVRHCFADITLARRVLDYSPRIALGAGIEELTQSLEGQIAQDRSNEMRSELEARGLTL
jgi:dTDP-L-rhamnose 4-epimerase